MRAVLILAALCSLAARAGAAFEMDWPDARDAVMAGACARDAEWLLEASAARATVAGPPPAARWSFACSGGELFGLPEARGRAVEAGLTLDRTRWSARAAAFGSRLYEERTVALQGARRLPGGTVCVLRGRLVGIAADGCESRWSAAVDAGLARRVAGRLVLAASGDNIGGARIGDSPVCAYATLGAVLRLDGASLEASMRTEAGQEASTVVAVEADAGEWLRVRASAGTAPDRFSVGFGIGRPAVDAGARPVVDVAWTWHPRLGASTFVTVRFGG
jgi:hypothetical protein